MARLREWIIRLWETLRPRRDDRDLEAELRLHRELAEEHARRGADSPETAARSARIRAGGLAQAMEALRDQHSLPWLRDLGPDLHYASRTLRKSPGFSMVAILTLALGIGATTAIYSIVDTILLQPLPFRDADRLVRLVENVPNALTGGRPFQREPTYQAFLEWCEHSSTLSDLAAFTFSQGIVRTRESTARLWGTTASDDAFTLLGTRAMLGRTFGPGDAANPNVVVLGFDTWRRLFQAHPDVIGTSIELEAAPAPRLLTVIGVLPRTNGV